MHRIPVFWLERTDLQRLWLRRYRSDCPAQVPTKGYCNAMAVKYDAIDGSLAFHGDVNGAGWEARPDGTSDHWASVHADDPLWPDRCERCGRAFHPTEDVKQLFAHPLYRGAPDGKLYTLYDAPVGAMWDAHRMTDAWRGPDGICLMVKTPGGDWLVDGQASNCTRPQEVSVPPPEGREGTGWYRFERSHYCWVRHGDPRQPATLHVDKNGNTCQAGAGSIVIGGWHGFLHHGHLTPC
ncbi:MAG: hypothetical protein ABS52_19550 [Gemmatimonadetes bacterium SCN 70-22]|nr:MAG: hypothetical protein ABS52_19550 [Gemmatimonadetes bacterium SCN 70-22]